MRDPLDIPGGGPAIFRGQVRHRRFSPVPHEFTYEVFMAYLDIDRLAEALEVSRWSAYNKPALLSFQERDHFGDPALPLRERLREDAARDGRELPAGPIYLLTNLRCAGYCFNPISLYYCYETGGRLALILAEVNNTFGGSHNYWLPETHVDHVAKKLHVSPFNTMDNHYRFALNDPAKMLSAHIENFRQGERFFDATLTLRRFPWDRANVERAIRDFPLMTLKVISAIHWEALKLFWKRVPYVPHPGKVNG
jgi:uncharacterized protein